MKAIVNDGIVKGLTYKSGTKEEDPQAIGRIVIELDADEANAGEIAALIGTAVRIELESPQMALPFTRAAEGGA